MTEQAKPEDPKVEAKQGYPPLAKPLPPPPAPPAAKAAPKPAAVAPVKEPTFTGEELEVAFNALHVRVSPDGGLSAYDHQDNLLPVEKMTPVQRAAFERMDALHRVPKKD